MNTFLGSLVQLCYREGGTLQTSNTSVCGECSQSLGHTGFAGGPERGKEGKGWRRLARVCRRAGEPRPGTRRGARVAAAARSLLSRLCPDRPPGLSRAATPRASQPASRRSGGPGTRRRGLREGWWRRGAGQSSRPRLPSGRGPRPSAPAPRPHAPAESAARAAAEPGAPPCRGPPRSCSPASSGFARSCPGSQVSTYALVEVPPHVKNAC